MRAFLRAPGRIRPTLLGAGAAALAALAAAPASAAPHRRLGRAEYNVAISVRDALAKNARMTLRKIARCESRAAHPYGPGLDRFNRCIRTWLSVEVEFSRFDPVLLEGVTRHLEAGRCLDLVGSLSGNISDLGEVASTWSADIENGGPGRGKLERRDAAAMRQVVRAIVKLQRQPWRRACRLRPGGR